MNKMRISIQEICKFACATPQSKNFIGGENIINGGHLLNCGKVNEDNNDVVQIAFCLQTANLRGDPHEINGEILNDGRIIGMSCTCKAGLGSACKHTVAVLLFCNRNDLENLKIISCTDKKCAWNAPKKSALEEYEVKPLALHNCFFDENTRKNNKSAISKQPTPDPSVNGKSGDDLLSSHSDVLDEIQQNSYEELFRAIMIEENPSSALAKHVCGRHSPMLENNNTISISFEKITDIINNQDTSEFLKSLSILEVECPKRCCEEVLCRFLRDPYTICIESMELYSVWLIVSERQFRITASNAYSLFSYRNNKSPDWEKKSNAYFYGASFSNDNTKYGVENEPLAREAYKELMSVEVVECGLVVSKTNPWLGCSPDGIVFKDGKLSKLIEIKCPTIGKKHNVDDLVELLKWLEKKDGQLALKKNHLYYAQVQISMAILNLPSTDVIIYSSFDKGIKIIPINFNLIYTTHLLFSLKSLYFNKMLHNICEREKVK